MLQGGIDLTYCLLVRYRMSKERHACERRWTRQVCMRASYVAGFRISITQEVGRGVVWCW